MKITKSYLREVIKEAIQDEQTQQQPQQQDAQLSPDEQKAVQHIKQYIDLTKRMLPPNEVAGELRRWVLFAVNRNKDNNLVWICYGPKGKTYSTNIVKKIENGDFGPEMTKAIEAKRTSSAIASQIR